MDVREIDQDSLLAQIASVPQESILFSGTIRDNIRYGRQEASDAEVEAAAKAARRTTLSCSSRRATNSHVEARGTNFSAAKNNASRLPGHC